MRTPTVSGGPGDINTGSRVADHPHPSIMGRAAEKLTRTTTRMDESHSYYPSNENDMTCPTDSILKPLVKSRFNLTSSNLLNFPIEQRRNS